jgi:hypothetical protein
MEKGHFWQRFIPTVFWYTAFSSNLWNITNQDTKNALLYIWKTVYKGTVDDINNTVVAIVSTSHYFQNPD